MQKRRNAAKKQLRIALVSDFFCPNTGGVETHLYHLGGCLLKKGHHVIVLTHVYGDRKGIIYLSNGLKVYHIPFFPPKSMYILPSVWGSCYFYREILKLERIDIIHGHSAFSPMAHEAMLHGWCMGLNTVFTDHSLFGFSDISAILINRLLLRYSLPNIDRSICVSRICKENIVLRGGLDRDKVSVIPNAIDASRFLPADRPKAGPLTIIIVSRLVYRKGADLLVKVIPRICQLHPDIRIIIGGDGPKRVDLEEMREIYSLEDRVEMRGMLPHNKVRDVLIEGDIFLNCSLTEAFCVAIVEAASCGLHVVSTAVGGVPEVLPPEYITLAKPDIDDIVQALSSAIEKKKRNEFLDRHTLHKQIKQMYRWEDVAKRTEKVYTQTISEDKVRIGERLKRHDSVFGMVWLFVVTINILICRFLDLMDNLKTTNRKKKKRK
ncbi:unnamed protein product [Bursaphelenchus xylophilus]|uniref:(pine wood nematode) hypothetical protein n=1 Tax=Bursaphelenchus xylophilus TaxID=6326 RepID=A0A7I8WPQ9_BURXY|nr:unnamed protein product [Bursaphelenchus xylophilus]CAG9095516.1 unnamed protein product [Bursaphelenchus xylophilus]